MTYKQLGCYFCSGLVMMGKRTLILIKRVNYMDHKVEGGGDEEKFTASFFIYPSSFFNVRALEISRGVKEICSVSRPVDILDHCLNTYRTIHVLASITTI